MTDQHAHDLELPDVLSAWWDTIAGLRVDSPAEDWDTMTAYLADDCVVHFSGMGAPASIGHDAVVADLRQVLTYWRLVERGVVSHAVDAAGSTVLASMSNRLEIRGQALEFAEAEVVTFDADRKIGRYELYCDPTPIKELLAR